MVLIFNWFHNYMVTWKKILYKSVFLMPLFWSTILPLHWWQPWPEGWCFQLVRLVKSLRRNHKSALREFLLNCHKNLIRLREGLIFISYMAQKCLKGIFSHFSQMFSWTHGWTNADYENGQICSWMFWFLTFWQTIGLYRCGELSLSGWMTGVFVSFWPRSLGSF